MFSSRLVFSRHCAFPQTLQPLLQVSASPLSTTPQPSPLATAKKSGADDKRPVDFIHPSLGSDANDASIKKPGLLKRLGASIDTRRQELEKEWLDKHEAGLPSRITPELKNKFDEYQNSERILIQRERLYVTLLEWKLWFKISTDAGFF